MLTVHQRLFKAESLPWSKHQTTLMAETRRANVRLAILSTKKDTGKLELHRSWTNEGRMHVRVESRAGGPAPSGASFSRSQTKRDRLEQAQLDSASKCQTELNETKLKQV
jgi:hypothetical protein